MSDARKVRRIYRDVRGVQCLGLCTESCHFAPTFPAEHPLVEEAARAKLPPILAGETGACPLLAEGRCTIHDHRPLVCRLYGSVPEMRCPYGCEPTMSSEAGRALVETMRRLR